jgi:hypothetical protein
LYFVTPAASSISWRRSVGRPLRIIPILPCSMIGVVLRAEPGVHQQIVTSRRRQTVPSIRYSLSPERYNRRVTSTSRATDWMIASSPTTAGALGSCARGVAGDGRSRCRVHYRCRFRCRSRAGWPSPSRPGSGGNAGPLTVFRKPLNRSRTSAAAVGLRASLPLKMTSFHLVAAQALGALLAHHPRDRVGDVALAAPVGPDDRRDALVERELGPIGKRFEAVDL